MGLRLMAATALAWSASSLGCVLDTPSANAVCIHASRAVARLDFAQWLYRYVECHYVL
jgi:hypothetical protein